MLYPSQITVSTDTPDNSRRESPEDTIIEEEEEEEEDDDDDDDQDILFDITSVICKCGHRHFELPL